MRSVRSPIDRPGGDEFVDEPDRRAGFEGELRRRQTGGRIRRDDAFLRAGSGWAQRTAFFTSSTRRFSAAGVSSRTAKEVGKNSPSSILASGWNPKVE